MNPEQSVTPTTFESFNARNLSPLQVAKTFIPPKQFEDLILRRHSIVIGPRGSGKTTLLKMLQPLALAAWKHTDAERLCQRIDFTGVFVATDVSWGAQLDAMGTNKLPKDVREQLGRAAFCTHVLISFIDTIRHCVQIGGAGPSSLSRIAVELSKEQEAQFVEMIAGNWELQPEIPSLLGIILALRGRLSDIAKIAQREANSDTDTVLNLVRNTSFLHLALNESLVFGIEAFGAITNDEHRKWAFLFDELEIAPRYIRRTLFRGLRSTDQRLLYKLSISPYSEDIELLEGSASAMSMHDYQKIELWYPRKEEAIDFCNELLSSMLQEEHLSNSTATDVLGLSEFDPDDSDYAPHGKSSNRFLSLCERDGSFRAYLDKQNVDVNNMHNLSDNKRASAIRKVTSIVAIREAFKGKSRKNPDIYAGARSIFAIVEGNPRWFIGLTTPLIREFRNTGKVVDRAIQSRAISSASNRFRAQLKTIPYKTGGVTHPKGLLGLLDPVGEAFHRMVVDDPFDPEPALSFVVDASTQEEVIEALGRALNWGAIIYIPRAEDDPILTSLKGKRFRLSYMLAPHYKIPLLIGKEMSLKKILSGASQPDFFST